MRFETALNLLWLVPGLLALASTIRATLRQTRGVKRAPAWLHVVGVALIVAALFPYISATDDLVRIDNFNSQHSPQHGPQNKQGHSGKHGHSNELMWLYETMDSPLVCGVTEVALTFSLVWLVFTPVIRVMDRVAPFRAGRSPPVFVLA